MKLRKNGDVVLQRKVDIELLIRLDERTGSICTKVDEIKDTIKDYPTIKNDVGWLKRWFWLLITGVTGGLITSGLSVWGYFILKRLIR